ncbi:MAG: hypothetical protein ABIP95_12755 [Pelobium sp.]
MKINLLGILLIGLVSCQSNGKQAKELSNDRDTSNVSAVNDASPAQEKLPFPMQTGFTDAYLKATFWKCNYNSAGSENAYWVILPNTIKPTAVEPQKIEKVGLTNIGVYNTIDKSLPYIEVWVAYETLDSKQIAADWLLNKIRITGETILNQSPITYPNGQKNVDVLTSKIVGNGERVISRFTGIHNGDNYYVLKASCNEKDYKGQANTLFHIVSHWGLKQ